MPSALAAGWSAIHSGIRRRGPMPLTASRRTFNPQTMRARRAAASSTEFRPAPAASPEGALSGAVIAAVALACILCGAMVAFAGLNALYIGAALVGFIFILRDFRIGVVMLILFLPISRSRVFPREILGVIGLNPFNLLMFGTLVSCLVYETVSGKLRRFLPRPLFFFYLLPICVAGAIGALHFGDIPPSVFRSGVVDFTNTLGYLSEFLFKPLTFVLFALLVGAAAARSAKPERFLVPMLIAVWTITLVVVAFVVDSGVSLDLLANSESREFFSPLGLHANELGHLYSTVFAILLFMWGRSDDRRFRIAAAATLALVFVALLLTFSRSAFVGAAVVVAIYMLWNRNIRTLMFSLLGVVALMFVLPNAFYDRIMTGHGAGIDAISAGRVSGLWLPMLPEILKSPIYGSGLGSILWSEPMRALGGGRVPFVTHPHSAYLEAALDMGIIGFGLLCAYFVSLIRGFRRLGADTAISPTLRGFYLGACAGLIGLLIADLVDNSFVPRPEQVFLWFAVGMMYGQRAK